MSDRDPLLQEREKTHGSFEANARAWKEIHEAVSHHIPYKPPLNARQELALGMIILKIARILQNPLVKDHWNDIAGYAKLGAEACE